MAAGVVGNKCPPHLFPLSSNNPTPQSLKTPFPSEFHGHRIRLPPPQAPKRLTIQQASPTVQMHLIGKAHRWWEKGIRPNMKEVNSAKHLVDSLRNAGDQLVIVDFFSPGCGGCKALHPKIGQFAEMNPDVQFLQVNYEEHKSMCYSLNVHVLPFFRFYRGAHGRLCSFSCTNATVRKFKDALAKHTTDRCSLGPTKGLEEAELLALAANRDLSFDYTPKSESEPAPANIKFPLPMSTTISEKKSLVTSNRS